MSAQSNQAPEWSARMLLSQLIGKEVSPDPEICGITADSRMVRPGFVFAALKGEHFDGAEFIPEAIEAGAVAILADEGVCASVPVIEAEEPRLRLAQLAARFHAGQPDMIVAITGTNGKTSVASFAQQLWAMLGEKSGSLGTLGAFAPGYDYSLRHTTPDPVEIHQVLSTMAALGTTHLAMEVSSHGLSHYRADGVQFSHAAFCNITQDHLDFHEDFEDYFDAKLRLFTQLLPKDGVAVVNMDGAGASRVRDAVLARGAKVLTTGKGKQDLSLLAVEPIGQGLRVKIAAAGNGFDLVIPLFGDFQAENALVAAGLVMASGFKASEVLPLLENLQGAPGRMQLVGERQLADGRAGIYVDFAHTPDALARALASIAPHAKGRIHLVFGAGGDRDKEKRPLMGAEAAKGADSIIITDDNPRTEDAAQIRAQIQTACPQAQNIGDRRVAIRAGIEALRAGDVLIIAGKGHESGQTVGTVTMPFNDGVVARQELQKVERVC